MNWTPLKPVSIFLKSTNFDSPVSSMKVGFRFASCQIVGTGNPARNYGIWLEERDEMGAAWKFGVYLIGSLSAFGALLLGLFALPVKPIAGVLLTILGMALQIYVLAELFGAPVFKIPSNQEGEDHE
jgi:hypothetical protein